MGQGIVHTVTVKGNKSVSTEAILAAMQTKVGGLYGKDTADADTVAIQRLGFFQKVDVYASPEAAAGRDITVEVEEWPVVKEIKISGNHGVPTEELLKVVDVEPGKIFNTRSVQPSVDKIRELYKKHGLFADVSDFRLLADSPQTLSIVVMEMTINSISFDGNKRTKVEFLKRLMRSRPGDTLSETVWGADIRRIMGTNWYKDVYTETTSPEPGKMDMTVKVKEQKTGNIGGGLQATPGGPLALTLKVDESNYKGTGQMVGVNLIQGTRGDGLGADLNYGNPFLDKKNTYVQASLYSHLSYLFAGSGFGSSVTPTNDNLYTQRHTGGSLLFGRELNNTISASVGLRYEGITTNNIPSNTTTGFIQQDGTLATLTAGVTRNRRDSDNDPSRGDWFRVQVEPGLSHLTKVSGDLSNQITAGDNGYVKTTAEYRAYYSPQKPRSFEDPEAPRRVFALRARFGAIAGNVPFSEQFFAGGGDTVRGYEDDRFWGKETLVTTLEYRHPLQKALSLIGFVDYGGAWGGFGGVNTWTQSSDFQLNLGYGVGVSYRVPQLGPLRLDLGFDKYGHARTHFQITTSF